MVTCKIGKTTIKLPEHVAELTHRQRNKLIRILSLDCNDFEYQDRFLVALLGRRSSLLARLGDYDLCAVHDVLKWVSLENIPSEAIVKSFKFKAVTYFAPLEDLKEVTTEEWVLLDTYTKALKSNPDYLDKIVAIVYRKKDEKITEKVDKREKLTNAVIDKNSKLFKTLGSYEKLSALYYVLGCREKLHSMYFKRMHEKGDPDPLGWTGTLLGIAQSQVFGTAEQVKKTSIHETCMFLLKNYHEYQKMKRDAKQRSK